MMDSDYSGGSMNAPLFNKLQDSRWRSIYPAQFFDPLAMQTVADPKILIMWSRFFYDWHPVVHAAINGMVTYPITDFVFETTDSHVRQNYEDAFKTLKVRDTLIKIGLDYYISGMSAYSVLMPFKRMLKCPKCGSGFSVETAKPKKTGRGFVMICGSCKETVIPVIEDTDTTEVAEMKSIHWNPLNLRIVHDELLNDYTFYYTLPSSAKNGILKGEQHYLEHYPRYMLDAAVKNSQLKLRKNSVLFTRSPGHSASYIKGWGQPLITPSLKYLFHLLVLIRGQDALALDQILPWTIMSPAANGGADPVDEMDLNSWAENVRSEYAKWKSDPLYKSIMPIPMNTQIVGANGKNLMLNPEIDNITNNILAGMGVPNEFIFGGLQWSGASVSLRMLENRFINYRTMMQEAIDWTVTKIHQYLGYPLIDVHMQNFKMADDIAQKNLFVNLAGQGIISKRTLLNEIMPDIDYDKEQQQIKTEQTDSIKLQQEAQRASQLAGINMEPEPNAQGDGGQGGGGGKASQSTDAKPLPEDKPPRGEGGNKQI